jgi:hypothetical protein
MFGNASCTVTLTEQMAGGLSAAAALTIAVTPGAKRFILHHAAAAYKAKVLLQLAQQTRVHQFCIEADSKFNLPLVLTM